MSNLRTLKRQLRAGVPLRNGVQALNRGRLQPRWQRIKAPLARS